MSLTKTSIVPAKAGTQAELAASFQNETIHSAWIPAFAGMIGNKGTRG
jgi:hypothetical protein